MVPPALGEKTKNSNSFKVLISQTLKQVCGLLDSWAGQTSSGHGLMNQHLFATNKRLKEEEGQGRGEGKTGSRRIFFLAFIVLWTLVMHQYAVRGTKCRSAGSNPYIHPHIGLSPVFFSWTNHCNLHSLYLKQKTVVVMTEPALWPLCTNCCLNHWFSSLYDCNICSWFLRSDIQTRLLKWRKAKCKQIQSSLI